MQGADSNGWKCFLKGHGACLDPSQFCAPPDEVPFHPSYPPQQVLLSVFLLTWALSCLSGFTEILAYRSSLITDGSRRGREGALLRTPYVSSTVLSALLSPPVLAGTRKDVVVLGL